MSLAEIQAACKGIEDAFEHKAILYVGSQSYDAPTITLLRGLHALDFTIYTMGKPNINSWNINTVLPATAAPVYDFVLSNLHWGTRWSHYDRFDLHGALKVLVDGDDNTWNQPWRVRYKIYQGRYPDVRDAAKAHRFMAERWTEPLGSYEPDIVFAGQCQHKSGSYYLPFGIMPQYMEMAHRMRRDERDVFLLHVLGMGRNRTGAHKVLAAHEWPKKPSCHVLVSDGIKGERVWPQWVPSRAYRDPNVHSWLRWCAYKGYYKYLSRAHVLIYPGVQANTWESKRPWEAWACGCVVLMRKPPLDMSSYPIDELAPGLVYSGGGLLDHCEALIELEGEPLEELRGHIMNVACAYFTPIPIARYALGKIKELQ